MVFVTAFDEHAIKAFEVHAVDYLLKPIAPERIAIALERARERVRRHAPMPVAELAEAGRPEGGPLERVLVRQGPKVQVIPVGKLDWVEAQDDYVSLHSEGKAYLKQQTLTDLERKLDPARFVRIHRSYLINLDRLARIDTVGGEPRAVVLTDGRGCRSVARAISGSRSGSRGSEGRPRAQLSCGTFLGSVGGRSRSGTGASRKNRVRSGLPSLAITMF